MKRVLLPAALLSALVMGCSDEVHTGTVAKVPMVVGPLGAQMGAGVAVAPPRDVRPAKEHEGEEDRLRFFFTVAVVTHWERAGNYVTNDEAATPRASAEVRQEIANALTASRAAAVVPDGTASQFTLETELVHLYGTHYEVGEGTVVVIPGKRKGSVAGGGAGVTARQYASYGNVVLKARLVDRRTGSPVVVWEEHVSGSGQAAPSKEHVEAAQTAVRMATSDAIAQLSIRVGAALDRLGHGPNGAGYVLTQMPSVFLIERVSRFRDFLETVYVETRSGRVLRHDIAPLADHAWGRPGEWLLSRRTPEGIVLSGDGYETLARALADKYDVRAYDDVDRYHFFGVKGVVPAPPGRELFIMRGFFSQGVAVLFDRAPTLSVVADALATPILRRMDEPAEMWQLSGPSVIVDFRRKVNGLISVDVVDHPWPDVVRSPDVDAATFSAWSMGHFGPFAFPGNLERACEQAWTWEGSAATAIGKHTGFVRLRTSYAFGAKEDDPMIPPGWDPLSELRALTRLATRVTAIPGAIAFFDPSGEVVIQAREFAPHVASAEAHKHPPIDAWTNVRMLNLRSVAPGWMLMDTVGMAQLDRRDLECVFRTADASPDDVARFLRNLSLYVLQQGDVIADGHTVDGPGGKLTATRHEDGLSGPPRSTIRFFPEGVEIPEALTQKPS